MQNIIVKKTVEVPNMPRFVDGQKVRVSNSIADTLVDRGFAVYDQCEKVVTEKAKKMLAEKTTKIENKVIKKALN